jgi:hypothetical protein
MTEQRECERRYAAVLRFFVQAIEANRLWVNPATWAVLALVAFCLFIWIAPAIRGHIIAPAVTLLATLLFTGIGLVLTVCYLPIPRNPDTQTLL